MGISDVKFGIITAALTVIISVGLVSYNLKPSGVSEDSVTVIESDVITAVRVAMVGPSAKADARYLSDLTKSMATAIADDGVSDKPVLSDRNQIVTTLAVVGQLGTNGRIKGKYNGLPEAITLGFKSFGSTPGALDKDSRVAAIRCFNDLAIAFDKVAK